jgi:hypothetical protein
MGHYESICILSIDGCTDLEVSDISVEGYSGPLD